MVLSLIIGTTKDDWVAHVKVQEPNGRIWVKRVFCTGHTPKEDAIRAVCKNAVSERRRRAGAQVLDVSIRRKWEATTCQVQCS